MEKSNNSWVARSPRILMMLSIMLAGLAFQGIAAAKVVKVTMTAMETEVEIDNAGTKYAALTYDGAIPGPVVRITEGDTVDFKLVNPKENQLSHSMDFHAAVVDVLDEFASVPPGETKHFKFKANYPGIFIYHCGTGPMVQHIARGMFGIIIVDPKEGYSKAYPKPDREYILIQSQFFPDPNDVGGMLKNEGWTNALINGKIFHYDPVHDPNAKLVLESKPGELVRIFFINANVNMPANIHPIAGIWEHVYLNGNPRNTLHAIQTQLVPVAGSATFDIISPSNRSTNFAIVDHNMSAALRGAITILMNKPDADPKLGRGDKLLLR